MDGDGTEDAYDEDRDGDGFSNEQEIDEGTDPDDVYSVINSPILKTSPVYIDENGTVTLHGMVASNGQGQVEDFGFVLSSSVLLSKKPSANLWVRAEAGEPAHFSLTLKDNPFEDSLYVRAWARNAAGYGLGVVKKVVFGRQLAPNWWGEVEDLQGGWKQSSWFGAFRPYEEGWLYHARLGWLYAEPAPDTSVWLWLEAKGWLWTQDGIWPYMWSSNTSDWLYLYPGKPGEEFKFYDASIGATR